MTTALRQLAADLRAVERFALDFNDNATRERLRYALKVDCAAKVAALASTAEQLAADQPAGGSFSAWLASPEGQRVALGTPWNADVLRGLLEAAFVAGRESVQP